MTASTLSKLLSSLFVRNKAKNLCHREFRAALASRIEPLEQRAMLATFTVTSTNNDGGGSLRQAILSANASPGPDRIEFGLLGTGVRTINLTSVLPTITDSVAIDGSSQLGYTNQPLVEINGSAVVGNGFTIVAPNSEIRGLAINRFQGNGILINGAAATGNRIVANRIGTNAEGTIDLGNISNGVFIANATGNTIGGLTAADRNIISGNNDRGVRIEASNNTVVGNFIGTNASGTAAIGNTFIGVNVLGGSNNVIGGSSVAARNVISGNGADGVRIEGVNTNGNHVRGNYAGTDVTGMVAIPNQWAGVALFWDTSSNWVGGYGEFDGNLISGNRQDGIAMGVSHQNKVLSNIIGLATDGDTPLPNQSAGVSIYQGQNNLIGDASAGNLISSNGSSGIYFYFEAFGNAVRGNTIGLNLDGTKDRGNAGHGVHLDNVSFHVIGGTALGHANVISGNQGSGVEVNGSGALGNWVQQNLIGTDAAGINAIGNSQAGVHIHSAASGNIVAGGLEEQGATKSVIFGNGWEGIRVDGAGTNQNSIRNQYIGTDITGSAAIPNAFSGVSLRGGSSLTDLGSTSSLPLGNLISGNTLNGVEILSSNNNFISGNTIGLQADGIATLSNGRDGVSVTDSRGTQIGGPQARNVISANGRSGIYVFASSQETRIYNNYLGLDRTGQFERGNQNYGVFLDNVSNNRIGGPSLEQRNIISANRSAPIFIQGVAATNNLVQNNFVGTNSAGNIALSNANSGIIIRNASGNYIGTDGDGSSDATEGNLISGHGVLGALRLINASTNIIAGNFLGTDPTGSMTLVNRGAGITLESGSSNNRIGTNADGLSDNLESNVISGHQSAGIRIVLSNSNTIAGNRIGTDVSGTIPLPNVGFGISNRGEDNVIGVPRNAIFGSVGGNIIASNTLQGIYLPTGERVTMRGNSIYDNLSMGIDLEPIGQSSNDLLDSDTGVNGALNHPTLHNILSGITTQITGLLHSAPSATFTIDFYANSVPDSVRLGEGKRWLGSHQVTTDSQGNASFLATVGITSPTEYITSTTTDSLGNTSEFSSKMRRDSISPSSLVLPLQSPAVSLTIPIQVNGSDPSDAVQPGSGVKEYRVFVSEDGAPFIPWMTLPASSPIADFTAQSNRTYAFRSLAVDWAGNIESKPVSVEAIVFVPDVEPPTTEVASVDNSQRLFSIDLLGIDAGGSGLQEFILEVQVDGGSFVQIATVPARFDASNAVFRGSASYQAIADGQQHTYGFRSIGIDKRGNQESPREVADLTVTAAFAPPVALAITQFDVQRGATQRSYIQYLDLLFSSENGVQAILDSLNDGDQQNDRVRLRRFNLDGSGSGDRVLLNNKLGLGDMGNSMRIDFGSGGLTGDPLSLLGNGYYALELDLNGDGVLESVKHFYRLLGDVNGDRVVNALDNSQVSRAVGTSGANLNEDINGDGIITIADVLAVRRGIGRSLSAGLAIDD